MNGFDPHAGEVFDSQEQEVPDKVLFFDDYTAPKKD
jgi:hypothetical protein